MQRWLRLKIQITNHMKRPHRARHWGTNDHQTPREYGAACFHLCFPLRCFCAGDVRLQLFFIREGHPASILLPCGASPFRLAPAHPLPFIPPPPWGSSETGRQQLFSQHPGPFHTTGIMPSLHLIKVTPAYLCSCPTLAPLDLLSHTSVTAAHTHTHVHAGWKNKKPLLWENRILNHGCFKGWCSTAVSINAFNLSNPCCLGGRSDSNRSWH